MPNETGFLKLPKSLADRMGVNGHCWPGYGCLGRDLGLSRMTVIQGIKRLVAAGLIFCQKRFGQSNRYTIATGTQNSPVQNPDGGRYQNKTLGGTESRPESDSLNQTQEQDPPKTPSSAVHSSNLFGSEGAARTERGHHESDPSLRERFERFWTAYPRKEGKQPAWRVWLRLKPTEELTARMIHAVDRWKQTDQWRKEAGKYIPHPATWLNGERWEDELPTEPLNPSPNPRPTRPNLDDVIRRLREHEQYQAALGIRT